MDAGEWLSQNVGLIFHVTNRLCRISWVRGCKVFDYDDVESWVAESMLKAHGIYKDGLGAKRSTHAYNYAYSWTLRRMRREVVLAKRVRPWSVVVSALSARCDHKAFDFAGDARTHEWIERVDNAQPVEDVAACRELVSLALPRLTYRYRRVLAMRWIEEKTLEECAREFNVTRERIRSLEIKAITKLRNAVRLLGEEVPDNLPDTKPKIERLKVRRGSPLAAVA